MFRTIIAAPVGSASLGASPTAGAIPRATPARWAVREYALKRFLDVALASIGLAVSAPLWLLIGVAVKLEDGGPVFFRQMRWGRDKQPFEVYKFRSMVVDADARFGAGQAAHDDRRVTRVGRVLRATSLDELPQLLNIWLGSMSWVGPRALPMNEKQVNELRVIPDEAIRGFDLRCSVRPGLTGIAQVFAPRDIARTNKFRYDCFYIKRQSLWLDVKLIAVSCAISARARWETRGEKTAMRSRGRTRRVRHRSSLGR
jgi:lipopolysaccharide/colanic/teichoic acid biosynthesis glycosyltransferase